MSEVESRLLKCFSAVFPNLPPQEIVGAKPESVAEWDSVAHVILLGVVEEEFKLSIGVEELEGLNSFESILHYIKARNHPV
jgi:acyl carrier protein